MRKKKEVFVELCIPIYYSWQLMVPILFYTLLFRCPKKGNILQQNEKNPKFCYGKKYYVPFNKLFKFTIICGIYLPTLLIISVIYDF